MTAGEMKSMTPKGLSRKIQQDLVAGGLVWEIKERRTVKIASGVCC